MEKNHIIYPLCALIGMALSIFIYSCASIGSPNGGPYDEEPPKFINSKPSPGQLNFKGKKIELLFDELIQLDKPSENVIVTPPQMQMPEIRAIGRKITVELKDTLLENTTYTIDFTNSITDNNEKNVFENFSFAFSTGESIDTLEVSGILLNAEDLEPMKGITIGLHRDLEDSAFVKTPFTRTSRTNERGKFTIRNISPGTYRIYALNDMNRDYKFDQPGEDIAFCDSLIIPSFETALRTDTIWADTLTIDTIKVVEYTRYMPDDIELFLFKEKFERQYLLRPERTDNHQFVIRYNTQPDTIPLPIPLNFEPSDSNWYYIQAIEEGKSFNFWITDSTVIQQDTLSLELTYSQSDSLNILQAKTDTLFLSVRKRAAETKKKKKDKEEEEEEISFLDMKISASGSINLFDTLFVTFNEPILNLSKELFFLNQKVDTLWVPVDFELLPDSTNSLQYIINRPWKYGEEYLLEVDSATVFSIYNKWNNPHSGSFKVKEEKDYGHLFINIQGIDSPAFVELLDKSDLPVRKATVQNGGALFMDLLPNKYYARLVIDTNENGIWDTGNYAEKRQSEMVYYYPKLFEIRSNWKSEEDWDVLSISIDKQKPLDITKNKPKEVTKKQRDYKNEGRTQSSSSSGRGGFPF